MGKGRKSDTLDVDIMAQRIIERWNDSEQWMKDLGSQWYPSALEWAQAAAADTGHSVEQVAAVIAAYSPQTRWIDNLLDADNLLRGKGLRRGVMSSNDKRARNALELGLAGLGKGPKINAFARNILGDTDSVTVDVWAARAAFGTMDKQLAAAQLDWVGAYDRVSDAYRKAAASVGVPASMMQATVWIQIRGKA